MKVKGENTAKENSQTKILNLFGTQHVVTITDSQLPGSVVSDKNKDNNSQPHKGKKRIGVGFLVALCVVLVIVCIGILIDAPHFVASLVAIFAILYKLSKLFKQLKC